MHVRGHALIGCFLLVAVNGLHAQKNIAVEGMGFFADRRLDAYLAFRHDADPDRNAELDFAILEDSAFFLMEKLKREGYLKPEIVAHLRSGADVHTVRWQTAYTLSLDPGTTADSVVFQVIPGPLFYYDTVAVTGVASIRRSRLKRFFVPGGALFVRRRDRVFTPDNFDRRIGELVRRLDHAGRRSVRVLDKSFELGEDGAVRVFVNVDEGPVHRIRSVEIFVDGVKTSGPEPAGRPHAVFTPEWEREMLRTLRNEAYRDGYPDVRIAVDELRRETVTGEQTVHDMRFRVERGRRIVLRRVVYENPEGIRESVLRRQANLNAGQPLDLLEVNEARRRLMGLGVFSEVNLRMEPVDETHRDVVYELIAGPRMELSVLAGWGSYEQARAGLRWKHINPWGRAHRYEIGVKQSLRSSQADGTYTLPRIFRTDITAYGRAEYAFRELLSYDRTTAGLTAGGSTVLGRSGVSVGTEYGFEWQRTDRDVSGEFEALDRATVASLALRAGRDRRDNVLNPSTGHNLFSSLKTASTYLGGDVDFQRFEVGGSAHHMLSGSSILHIALRYGWIYSWHAEADNIPFNERFFPGGANSVRGYREGAASPLDARGSEIGAEAFLMANLEIEQRILRDLSLVAFVDAVQVSRDGQLGSGAEQLQSIGGGLRYRTVVGPIRLEYGHNPNRREQDPHGTFHVSIGHPF